MAILVTGGAGYIGSHAVLALINARRDVLVIDNLSTGFRDAVPSAATFIHGDIGDKTLVARVLAERRVSAVLHFAASVVVSDSVGHPLDYYANNTLKTCALIEACIAGGVDRFIFSSTAAVYGVPTVSPVPEDAPLAPISPYGASKAMSERILMDAADAHGLSYAILRYFNVAGADPAGRAGQRMPRGTHLIKVAVEAVVNRRREITVFGSDYGTRDGTAIRDYIHVSDLADAHLKALTHLEAGGASLVLNCGYGRGYTVREVIRAVEAESGCRLAVRDGPPRPGDPAVLVADTRLIDRALPWRPRYDDLRRIVRTALDFEASAVL
ncbi:MAG: UDP-glucose 4-epimerase GalE [Caulobacterales bacterium]